MRLVSTAATTTQCNDVHTSGRPTAQVEQTLFRVHRFFLRRHSLVFATMFSLRPGEGLEEGNSDEHPIVLEDVKAVDFERLLALFYPK